MQTIDYTITADNGLNPIVAGRLMKIAGESGCTVTIEKNGKTVNAKKLYAIIGLAIDRGDKVTLTVAGPSENETSERLKGLLLDEA